MDADGFDFAARKSSPFPRVTARCRGSSVPSGRSTWAGSATNPRPSCTTCLSAPSRAISSNWLAARRPLLERAQGPPRRAAGHWKRCISSTSFSTESPNDRQGPGAEADGSRTSSRAKWPGELQRGALARGRDPRASSGRRHDPPALGCQRDVHLRSAFRTSCMLWDELDMHQVGLLLTRSRSTGVTAVGASARSVDER